MKWYGKIGYITTEETNPGVWVETVTERPYYGNLVRNTHKWQSSETLNDDLNLSNELSIVADLFAYDHVSSIRYVEFGGAKWKVTNVEVKYPRLNLSIGGVYNGVTTS